jgi:hypothetical protein
MALIICAQVVIAQARSIVPGAHSLAMVHYRALEIKQVQSDTLSHLVLARSNTFSLATNGDLGMISECLEASQIYQNNTVEVGSMIYQRAQSFLLC